MAALAEVAEWPATAGVAVVDLGSAPDGAHRLLDVVGPEDRPLAWASVTKPATALAVLIAVEEGTLSLDEPAGPPGATVRHLLSHSSGLGPDPGPPMARPGARRIYSNAGYVVLGELVAARAGMAFAEYLQVGVLDPLRMGQTVLDDGAEGGAAAAGLVGPLADLVRLGCELASPTLVGAATHAAATQVVFPGLPGVLPGFGRFDPCDWGLGVEIRGVKHPHWTGDDNAPSTYGHFGRSGSFLWIDPVARLLCAELSDRAFGHWATRAWPRLSDEVLREVAAGRARRPDAG
ncbi:MAG: beta-lactamase family protein [Acidimicrobiales bacterium]|nr:beta-lactamase family protein [Acidimicrobiales bacterium]